MSETLVIALGGNAITRPGEPGTIPQQFEHTAETLGHLVPLFRSDARIVITHGNGPQIGNILIRSEEGERMRMLPICGPFPWVMTILASLRKSGTRWPRVSAVCSNCWGMVPGSPGRVIALPPRAMTRVSLMEGRSPMWGRMESCPTSETCLP